VHENDDLKEPMNVTVSILSDRSVQYDIHVMAVLKSVDQNGNTAFFQLQRMQCKDLSETPPRTISRDELIRWSCLPLDCDSQKVFCQDPDFSGGRKERAEKCNRYKCCPKPDDKIQDVPRAWKNDSQWQKICKDVKC